MCDKHIENNNFNMQAETEGKSEPISHTGPINQI